MRMRLRPNVLVHPSPTTGRFLLLIVMVVGGIGLIAGDLVHTNFRYHTFTQAMRDCLPGAADYTQLRTCMNPQYRYVAWFQLGGAATMVILSLLLLAFVPGLIQRRHKLKPAAIEGAQARIAELATEIGLRRVPRVFMGPAGQRDAFVFGLPGRYKLVLPKALLVRWRNKTLFDPVVRHELAHLKRHDVPLAWLAATVWIAAIPVLLIPVLLSALRLDFGLTFDFLGRCAFLLAVVWLVRRQVLRSREHDADLAASYQSGDWHPLWTVLQTSTGNPRGGIRQLISNHPTVAARMAVLADPARLQSVSFVDGLVAALLAGTLTPVLNDLFNNILIGTWNFLLVGLLLGPVLGVAVGAGLWRQALIDHVNGERKWPGGVVAGVVCGLVLAGLLDFSDVGQGINSGFLIVTFSIVLGASATILSAATGRIWADAAGRLPAGRRGWAIGLIVNSLFFGLALWALQWFPLTIEAAVGGGMDLGGFIIGVGGLLAPLTFVALIPVLVTMVALVLRRRVTPVPGWLLDGGPSVYAEVARRPGLPTVLLAGMVPGLIAATAIAIHREIAGKASSDAEVLNRYLLWTLTATFAAVAVSFMAVALIPRSGAAIGLVSGAVTALFAGVGVSAFNSFILGAGFSGGFWWQLISVILAQWFIGYLLVAPFALVSWPGTWRDVPGWLLGLISVLASGLVSLIAVGIALS